MTSETAGNCLVCGTETKNRCSACVKAGIDLFFCSPEHQKFVWPVHKYFCGPGKANPWIWPALTPDEACEALDKLHVKPGPSAIRFDTHHSTIADSLRVITDDNPEDFLRSYLIPNRKPTADDSTIACAIRIYLYFLRFPPPNSPPPPARDIPLLYHVSANAHMFNISIDTEEWRTPLLHRLSVFASWQRSPKPPEFDHAVIKHVRPDIIRYLDEVVIPADPEAGLKVRQAFVSRTAVLRGP